MASTNKTTHYELSQYVGSDKPTYLTDYNNDMSAIDTGIYNAQNKADSAYTLADSADGKADTAITNAGLAQGDASSALGKIGTMADLTTTEKTTLVGAANEINYNVGLFNLTSFNATNPSVQNASVRNNNITVATNSDGSLAKIYGTLELESFTASGLKTVTIPSSLRPSTAFTINSAGVYHVQNNSDQRDSFPLDINIATNGDITFDVRSYGSTVYLIIQLFPCLYWVKDFGDQPTPSN